MPRVDFYILSDPAADARLKIACRVVEKAYEAGQKIYVQTAAEADSKAIDDLLWTFSDRSFMPHEITAGGAASHERIVALIGTGPAPDARYRQLIVNLSDAMPADSEAAERIVEIIDSDAQRKALARERFRIYRERGCTLDTHNL
jgi:DNA polymerase-3 subunit chi